MIFFPCKEHPVISVTLFHVKWVPIWSCRWMGCYDLTLQLDDESNGAHHDRLNVWFSRYTSVSLLMEPVIHRTLFLWKASPVKQGNDDYNPQLSVVWTWQISVCWLDLASLNQSHRFPLLFDHKIFDSLFIRFFYIFSHKSACLLSLWYTLKAAIYYSAALN